MAAEAAVLHADVVMGAGAPEAAPAAAGALEAAPAALENDVHAGAAPAAHENLTQQIQRLRAERAALREQRNGLNRVLRRAQRRRSRLLLAARRLSTQDLAEVLTMRQ